MSESHSGALLTAPGSWDSLQTHWDTKTIQETLQTYRKLIRPAPAAPSPVPALHSLTQAEENSHSPCWCGALHQQGELHFSLQWD